MKVVQLTCVYPPYGGGIGEVARQYAALLTAEHQVSVITPRYYPAMTFTDTPGVTIKALRPLISWGKAAWLTNLKQALKDFDVVHLHYPFFGVHEQLPKFINNSKFILTYHMVPQTAGLKGTVMRLSQNYSDRQLSARAQVMTVATKDYLDNEALPRMGEENKWQVLPFGVDARFHSGEESEILTRKYKIRFGEAVILFVGTLDQAHYFKGLDILLSALVQVKSQNWKLIVVGGGGMRKHYEQKSKTLKISKNVFFSGYVPAKELPDYYRLASMLVLSSINTAEAFGLAALEAMASGKPVIASRLPGVRELVQHGVTGLLVPPADPLALAAAIESLILSPTERQTLGINAIKRVEENYRWSMVGHKLLEIYRNL